MSEKVKVTKEQAEAIRVGIADYGRDVLIDVHSVFRLTGRLVVLDEMPTSKLARAIFRGFEVEPEFGVGDWVVYKSNIHDEPIIRKVIKINEHIRGVTLDKESIVAPFDLIRHATPSEIAAEKERRTDKKLDGIIENLSTAERDQLYNKLMMMDVSE